MLSIKRHKSINCQHNRQGGVNQVVQRCAFELFPCLELLGVADGVLQVRGLFQQVELRPHCQLLLCQFQNVKVAYQCYWKLFLWGFEAYHVLVWTKNHQGLQSQYHRGHTTRDGIIIPTNDGRVRGAACLLKLCLGVSFAAWSSIQNICVERDSICCGGVKNGKGGLYRELSNRFRPWKQEELRR